MWDWSYIPNLLNKHVNHARLHTVTIVTYILNVLILSLRISI